MLRSSVCGLMPRPTDNEPCGSKSTSSTLRPSSASDAPRLMVVVVLPTPPFWLHMAITTAGPCPDSGSGSGSSGHGRPVGPSSGPGSTTGAANRASSVSAGTDPAAGASPWAGSCC